MTQQGERWRGLALVAVGLALGLLGTALASESGVAEASVVLASALATVGGAKIGHSSGGSHDEVDGFDVALVGVAALAAGGAAVMLLDDERVTASVALIVAAAGLAGAHLLHHGLTKHGPAATPMMQRVDEVLGWAAIVGASLVGVAGIALIPGRAEAVATVAAAGITVGGTLLGHARGRHPAFTSRAQSRPAADSPGATPPGTGTAPPTPH